MYIYVYTRVYMYTYPEKQRFHVGASVSEQYRDLSQFGAWDILPLWIGGRGKQNIYTSPMKVFNSTADQKNVAPPFWQGGCPDLLTISPLPPLDSMLV